MSHANLLAKIVESLKTKHGFYYCQWIDSNTRWKRSNTSNKVRGGMTKKQMKGEKEFFVSIPDMKIHTSPMVREVKFSLFKLVFQSGSNWIQTPEPLSF